MVPSEYLVVSPMRIRRGRWSARATAFCDDHKVHVDSGYDKVSERDKHFQQRIFIVLKLLSRALLP